jgi:NADPH:quinone reductase-like Zn-dependent oxidoreductase
MKTDIPAIARPPGHGSPAPSLSPPGGMRAVVQDGYGDADVLRATELPRPSVGRDEILVRVAAAGVDRGTWHTMTGRPYLARLALGLRRQRQPVPGLDVAGTVVAVGAAVTRFAVGDEVYGFGTGTFAEYAVAKQKRMAHKPAGLGFIEAAAVPVSAVTALMAVHDLGHVQPGQSVLVLGASGGVGSYAVQMATAAGARVTGVCSAGKADLVRSLGAVDVLDRETQDFAALGRRWDLVLDIAGNPTLSRLRRALTPTGTAVIVGGEEGGSFSGGMNRPLRAVALSLIVKQRLVMVVPRQAAADLDRLSELLAKGALRPSVSATYPLEHAADALRDLAAGKVRGKAVITVGEISGQAAHLPVAGD